MVTLKNNYKKIIIVASFILIFSLILISVGVYFNIVSKDTFIAGKTIDKVSYFIKNYIDSNDLALGDNFTIKSNIDVNLESELYQKESLVNSEYLVINNYIKNISNLESNFIFMQDVKNKEAYFEANLKFPEEKLLNYKRFINDSTEYYFVEDVLNNYVNNGNCNYFESLNLENTTKDNINYLYDFIIESLKNNLESEYFSKYIVDGNKGKINQISLKLNDTNIRKILKGILNNLKEDDKANKILTGIDEDFKSFKIKDKTEFLNKDESYTINIYTTRLMNKFLKLELIHMNGVSKNIIVYEGDSENGTINYIKNDKALFIIDCKFSEKEYDFTIKDGVGKKVGLLKINDGLKRVNLSFSWNNVQEKIDLNYTSKKVLENNKNIVSDKMLSLKIIGDKVTILNGNVHIVTNIFKTVEINEDVSNAVLKASLTEDEKNAFSNKTINIFERLAR